MSVYRHIRYVSVQTYLELDMQDLCHYFISVSKAFHGVRLDDIIVYQNVKSVFYFPYRHKELFR